MKCEHCGNEEVAEGGKFCRKCGTKINHSQVPLKEKTHHKKTEQVTSASTKVVSFIVFILAVGVGRYISQEVFHSSASTDLTTPQSINKIVTEMKTKITLPSKIDEVTTLVDVTAEPSAIRYHYVIEGADTSSLKDLVLPKVCQTKETKEGVLDKGVGMQYSYLVKETGVNYYVSLTKSDCQK